MGGTILHWDGSNWLAVSSPTGKDLYSIYMLLENDGWAGGRFHCLLHWDGKEWTEVGNPVETIFSIYMLAPNDGWIAGFFLGE
jgi:hypothetical protein